MALARRFEEMTSADLRRLAPQLPAAVAILPVAAIEQHGKHIPLGTDAMIADAMIDRLLSIMPDDLDATVLPVQRIGTSDEHSSFPGTLSLDWKTGTETLLRIGEGLARAGFRRLAIVSSHGGNTQVVEIAALELRRRLGLLCATCSWGRFGVPDGLLPESELSAGIHGGALETSLMLAFRPDLVRMDEVADEASLQSRMAGEHRHLRAHGRLGFGWLAEDLNPVGTVGNARLATPEIGEAIATHQAARFAEFIADVAAFDLDALPVQL